MYTAPTAAGTYTVKATSMADSSKSASATVTVNAPVQHSVTLTWGSESTVVGYNVYRGSVSGGPYTMINTSLNAPANYVDLNVQAGQTYFYAVTAVNGSGVESGFSSEVKAVIPTP
jgi:fibronectin type 3 domain-containing protein